jgi:hypothetical protein
MSMSLTTTLSKPPARLTASDIPARLSAASRAIAACEDLSEIKQIDDQAEAMRLAAMALKMSPEIIKQATRVKNEALLRLGELIIRLYHKPVYRKGAGATSGTASPRTLAVRALGLPDNFSYLASRIASGGPTVREKILNSKSTSPTILSRLAPGRRNRYGNRGFDSADGTQLAHAITLALFGLRKISFPLSIDPRDKARIRSRAIELQEMADAILQALE